MGADPKPKSCWRGLDVQTGQSVGEIGGKGYE